MRYFPHEFMFIFLNFYYMIANNELFHFPMLTYGCFHIENIDFLYSTLFPTWKH